MMEPSRRKQEGEDEDEEEEEEYMEREEEEVALVAGVDEEEGRGGGDDNVVAVAAAACNIPHMHLFMYLKRRFPGLKDAFITDAIQRFGLDRTRCEDELARKSQEQPRSYYSLWNRSRTNSRGSTSSRSSPYSPSEAYPPLQNGNSHHSTPHSAQPSFSLNRCYPDINKENPQPFLDFGFDAGKQFEDSEPPPPLLFENRKYSSPQLSEGVFGGVSNGFSNPRELPTSAPIIPEPREPLFDRLSPCRRKSAATVSPEREPRTTTREDRFIFHQTAEEEIPLKIFSPAKEFSRSPSPSPSPTNTSTPTMSPPSNASSPPTTHTSLSGSPVNGQKVPHQQILQQQHQESPSATIQEQIARKDKLKEELSKRIDEKSKLETEVKNLTEELESRERNQRSEVIRCKKEIEQIQQENSKLQFVCDEMERKILESGESPKTDQEGRFAGTRQQPLSPNELSSPNAHFQDSPLRIQLPKQLASASSTSSLSSGGIGTPTPTTLVPSRKAPSPPISSPLSPSRVSRIRGYEQGEGRTETTIGGGDDIGKEWSCSKCTFINSPYLNVCEICGYPHFSLGTAPHQLPSQNTHTAPTSSSTPNPGGPCYCHHRRHHNINHEHRNAGEMQDIHIQVRHQNLHSPMREI